MESRDETRHQPGQTDWHDDVVTIAVMAKRAGIKGPLHDMVINNYFRGLAVPRHQDDWHMDTLKNELRRVSLTADDELAALAEATLARLP